MELAEAAARVAGYLCGLAVASVAHHRGWGWDLQSCEALGVGPVKVGPE